MPVKYVVSVTNGKICLVRTYLGLFTSDLTTGNKEGTSYLLEN